MQYDIVVIGSGSVGSFAGYYAAKSGKKICYIDKFPPPHDQASYHGDTRIFRIAYGEGARYIPLLQRAYTLWGEFERCVGERLFERCGVLNIGDPNSEFMRNVAKSSHDFALNVENLTPAQMQSRYNLTLPGHFVGILERDTGFVYSDRSVECAIKGAQECGADLLVGDITAITKREGGYHISLAPLDSTHTPESTCEITAKSILLSAGSFASEVLEACAFALPTIPVSPKRKMLNWFSASGYKLGEGMPAFIMEFDGDHFYGFPDFGGGVKIGLNVFGQEIAGRGGVGEFGDDQSDTSEIDTHIRTFMPGLHSLTRGAVCTYAMTPDEGFIIEFIDDGFLYLGGLSHGFKFAPALGELAHNALQTRKLDSAIKEYFSLARFG